MTLAATTLPNGLRVVTDAMPHLETAAVGVWIGAGSRHEKPTEHGLSHFLEHMAFKGTRRRTALQIAEEIESAGGDLNATTGVEQTSYNARVLASDTNLALDMLSDILTDSVFDEAEIEREKMVILQEISSVEDMPEDYVFDVFTETAFPDQPLGRPILGTPAHVKSFDKPAIERYLADHYRTGVTVVAAAGAVDHARIVEEVGARFTAMPAEPEAAPHVACYVGGETRLKRRIEQAHLVVGFEGRSFHDVDDYAAHVFSGIAGGGMSSRLFQQVREERGLVYTINSFYWPYSDTGVFGFYAGTSARELAELLPVAVDCLGTTVQSLTEAEVERNKAQMKVGMLVALESSSARAEQIARQTLAFGKVLSREEIIARIDALSVEDVRRAGAALITSAPTVVALGPIGKVWSPDKVAARLKGV